MNINLQNIEEIIFFDKKIHNILPEFKHYFNQFFFSKSSGLNSITQKTLVDFLNSLENQHITKLEEYFKEKIYLDKIDYKIVKNTEFSILELEDNLCQFEKYKEFSISRNQDNLKITFWK